MDQEFFLTEKFLTTHLRTMNYYKKHPKSNVNSYSLLQVLNTFKLTAFKV